MCIATPRKIDTVCQSSDLSCFITIYLWFVTILVGNDVSILFGGCYLLVVETTGNDSGRGCYQASSKQGTREATTASSEPWLMTRSSRFPKVDSPERRHQRIPVVFGNSERSASCNIFYSRWMWDTAAHQHGKCQEMPGIISSPTGSRQRLQGRPTSGRVGQIQHGGKLLGLHPG